MFPFSRTILDFLFPPFCVGCGKDSAWLCEACLSSIPLLEIEPDQVALSPYSHPTTRKIVTNLKYQSATCLIEAVESLLERYRKEQGVPVWSGTIVSVPASEKRLRERGVDQAALIADVLKKVWFPQSERKNLLARTKHTLPNAKLEDERARQGNVSQAFVCSVKRVAGSVILVDDVYTTGATMNECARVLREAGATDVKFFTVAKG